MLNSADKDQLTEDVCAFVRIPSRSSLPGALHEPNEFLSIHEAWAGCRVACRAVQRWLQEN